MKGKSGTDPTLTYLIELDFPTERAYAKNVVSTLAVLASQGKSVKILAGGSSISVDGIKKQYGVESDLEFNFSSIGNVKGKLIFMGLLHFFKVVFKRNIIISGRFIVPIYFLSFFRTVNFEYHSPIWLQGAMYHFMFRRLMKSPRCKTMLVPNENLFLDFFKSYPAYERYQDKLCLVSNGASKKDIEIKTTNVNHKLALGYIGSFYPGKGLEVIEQLVRDTDKYQFHLAGGPAELLHKNYPDLLNNQNVKYHGYLNAQEIDELAVDIDVFLLPNAESIKTGAKSDIGRYTNPLKLFEYMSYYRPIICSDLDYLRNVLKDLGVYASSLDDWKDAIHTLENSELRINRAKEIKRYFDDNYAIEKRAEKLYSILAH